MPYGGIQQDAGEGTGKSRGQITTCASGDAFSGAASPNAVYDIWAGDFDYLYHRTGEGVYTLTMHPQVIGRGHRLLMFERLYEHIRSKPGVTFAAMSEVANEYQRRNPLS